MTFNYDLINKFNDAERLWLLGDVVAHLGDAEAELSDECIEAVDAMEELEDIEKLRLIYGIAVIKFDSSDSPTEPEEITNYCDCPFAFECADTWGDFLEKLSFNDASWILYSLVYNTRDYSQCKHYDALDELDESIENDELNEDELKLLGCQLAFSIGTELY